SCSRLRGVGGGGSLFSRSSRPGGGGEGRRGCRGDRGGDVVGFAGDRSLTGAVPEKAGVAAVGVGA
ncbi:MAG: hypothetical protein ACK559_32680, partial [bacterium]